MSSKKSVLTNYFVKDTNMNDKVIQNLQVKVHRLSNRSCEFDIVGVDASITNALRRILISEVGVLFAIRRPQVNEYELFSQVPTIAIEDVYVWNNTSIIADEVLSHRLGLVPLNIDPALLDTKEGMYYYSARSYLLLKAEFFPRRSCNGPKYYRFHTERILQSKPRRDENRSRFR